MRFARRAAWSLRVVAAALFIGHNIVGRGMITTEYQFAMRGQIAGSAMAFEGGSIGLYQFLLRKQWDSAGWTAPTTREDLYA